MLSFGKNFTINCNSTSIMFFHSKVSSELTIFNANPSTNFIIFSIILSRSDVNSIPRKVCHIILKYTIFYYHKGFSPSLPIWSVNCYGTTESSNVLGESTIPNYDFFFISRNINCPIPFKSIK